MARDFFTTSERLKRDIADLERLLGRLGNEDKNPDDEIARRIFVKMINDKKGRLEALGQRSTPALNAEPA